MAGLRVVASNDTASAVGVHQVIANENSGTDIARALTTNLPKQVALGHVAIAAQLDGLEVAVVSASRRVESILVENGNGLAELGFLVIRMPKNMPEFLTRPRIVTPKSLGAVEHQIDPAIGSGNQDRGAESPALIARRFPASFASFFVECDQALRCRFLTAAFRQRSRTIIVAILNYQVFEQYRRSADAPILSGCKDAEVVVPLLVPFEIVAIQSRVSEKGIYVGAVGDAGRRGVCT